MRRGIIFLVLPFFLLIVVFGAGLNIKLPFDSGESFILTRGYDTQTTHVGKDIYALDFTKNGCDGYDQPVLAVAGGVVQKVVSGHVYGEANSYGNYIILEHEGGILSRYGHLNNLFVHSGDSVIQGQKIGTQGNTGSVFGKSCKEFPGTHHHFVMYIQGDSTLKH